MNVLLWIFQIALALHTAVGAVWKFSNPPPVPGLTTLPHGAWLALSAVELLCSLGLILPFIKRLGILAPITAGFITLEMLVYILASLISGSPAMNQIIYWAVVAVVSLFIVIGRTVKPIQ